MVKSTIDQWGRRYRTGSVEIARLQVHGVFIIMIAFERLLLERSISEVIYSFIILSKWYIITIIIVIITIIMGAATAQHTRRTSYMARWKRSLAAERDAIIWKSSVSAWQPRGGGANQMGFRAFEALYNGKRCCSALSQGAEKTHVRAEKRVEN